MERDMLILSKLNLIDEVLLEQFDKDTYVYDDLYSIGAEIVINMVDSNKNVANFKIVFKKRFYRAIDTYLKVINEKEERHVNLRNNREILYLDSKNYIDFLNNNYFDVEKICENKETIQEIIDIVDCMSFQKASVFKHYYGLDAEKLSVSEIASKYQCSGQRIYVILSDIKKFIAAKLLENTINFKLIKKEDINIYDLLEIDNDNCKVDYIKKAFSCLSPSEQDELLLDYVRGGKSCFCPAKDKYNKLLKQLEAGVDERLVKGLSYKKVSGEKNFFSWFSEYSYEEVMSAIDKLDDEERYMLELRYGLNGHTKVSSIEISNMYNVYSWKIDYKLLEIRIKLEKILDDIVKVKELK